MPRSRVALATATALFGLVGGLAATALAATGPVAAGGSARSAGAAAVLRHAVRVGRGTAAGGWASANWSGYARGGRYHAATARWVVPTVRASRQATYSSSWVGIDGFTDSQLIQTGTEQDYVGGRAYYGAWWEILPAPETRIPSVPVHPGDVMTASIARSSGTRWTITITDTTDRHSFRTTQTYAGPGSSVEWIQEAPEVNGSIAPLATDTPVTFDPGTANGAGPRLTATNRGVLVQNGRHVSTPSLPDRDADGFVVVHGGATPPPPSS